MATPSPSSALVTGVDAHRPSRAYRLPALATAWRRFTAAAGCRTASTSTSSVSPSGSAATSPTASKQARQQRAELELVEQHTHLLAIPCARGELRGGHADLHVAQEQRHLPVEQDPVRYSPRFWRCLGGRSSRCSKISSSVPYVMISLAAVFSPIPGTPGRLSLVSPRSAAYSTYCAAVTPPVRSTMPASS